MIKLSVLIPVWNQEELVIKALDSIPRRNDIEVFVRDDCSTDNTKAVVRQYVKDHPDLNLKSFANRTNKGFAYTVNKLVASATGEYIYIMDSDDYLYTEEFDKAVNLLTGEYDVVFVNLQTNDGTILSVKPDGKNNPCANSTRLVKREFVKGLKHQEDRIADADRFFAQDVLARNPKCLYSGITAYHYNYPREGSLSDLLEHDRLGQTAGSDCKLTIIVPVWNQEELVIRALDSVPRIDGIEVLVCDDGSTDNTLENVKQYAKDNPDIRIRIISNLENMGLGYTKNRLYDNARGEYIYELDSDDYLLTDEFKQAMPWLDGTDLVFVNLRINSGETLVLNENSKNTWVGGASKFIRREYLGNIRCENVRVFEDVVVNKGIMSKPHTEKFTGLTVYHYNHPREGSLCWLGSRGLIK